MTRESEVRYPGENAEYRSARDQLLLAEVGLRRRTEEVAALRRGLPLGGLVRMDYEFTETSEEGAARTTRLSQLFADGKETVFIYGLMFHPDGEMACPMCTSFLDGLQGQAPYIEQRINLAVVGKAPSRKLQALADGRGWNDLRVLSSFGTTFNRDYHAENDDGSQLPSFNVFQRTAAGIHHWYGSELFFQTNAEGMDPRHVDGFWPLWGVLDMTPEGRGAGWYPDRVNGPD